MKNIHSKKRQRRNYPLIRVGDTVTVISGKDKGATGEVLSIDWRKERLLVKGVNMVSRHVKPNQQNQQGGIFTVEASIHYSNVLLYNSSLNRGVRTRVKRVDSGVKQRICVKTSNVIE